MASLLENFSWKFAERIASQLIALVVSILLARLLDPSDYGLVAIVTIFVNLAYVLVEGGFSGALIQKKDADKLDFSTVFVFTMVLSLALYLAILFFAPYIASFFFVDRNTLVPVLRVLSLQIIIFGINSVQQAYVSRMMIFKRFFWATFVGTLVSGIVGITMALNGFGVWSIVGQQLSNSIVNTLTLYLITRKLPSLSFSFDRFKSLFRYGIKLLGASMLVTGYQEFRSVVIGRLYSAKDLAFFDRGKQFPWLIAGNTSTSIAAVLFPKMSQFQENIVDLKSITRKSIRYSSYILAPLMFGLLACAEPLVKVLLTEKWLPCVPIMQVICIGLVFEPIHTANLQAIKAIGRSDIFFYLEIVKKSIEIVTLLLVMRKGIMAIVISMAVLNIVFIFLNAYPNTLLLKYSLKEQLVDFSVNFLCAILMGVVVYFEGYLPMAPLLVLLTQVSSGVIVYLILSLAFRIPEFIFIIDALKDKLKKTKYNTFF